MIDPARVDSDRSASGEWVAREMRRASRNDPLPLGVHMASNGAFVLPAGVKLSLDGDALSIENPGDIVIEGLPAQKLKTLRSGGDVVLTPPKPVSLDSIHATSGTVTIKGKVTVGFIEANDVDFAGGTLKAKVIKAAGQAVFSGTRLEADVVVAAAVDISPDLKGRATAIQSDNELGAHKLKGGFDLAEFVSLMPGGAELLEAHGIEVPEVDDDDDEDEDEDEDEDDEEDEDEDDEPRAGPESEAAAVEADPIDGEVLGQVEEALAKIESAYEGELPPPIALLGQLVSDGDFVGLKMQINTIWSDLLKHHQQTGLYISNTVTHMFQTIQLLMRKVDG